MQSQLGFPALVIGQRVPVRAAGVVLLSGCPTGTRGNPMQHCPEQLGTRRRPSVSLVQHSEPLRFDNQSIGVRRPLVIEKTTVTFP